MLLLPLLLTFIIGLFIGSFLLVVATHTAEGKSWIRGRSRCDGCGHTLSPLELIPVVSFILQKGKCRHCHMRLSLWYPLSEILTGILFVIVMLTSITPLQIAFNILIVSCLLVIFFADREYEVIPVSVVIFASVATLIYLGFVSPSLIIPHLLSGLGAGAMFLLIFLITKGKGMGFGDVIYALFMGFVLGFPAIIFGLYIAFLTGAVVSLILVLLKLKKLRGGTVPFGPFLVLGTFTMMIWSSEIMQVVAKLLHLYS